MMGKYKAENHTDDNGNPTGGGVEGVGLKIEWQNGPLGRGENRTEPNGAFVETVIDAARQRIQYYQDSKFACNENKKAIEHLERALYWLNLRTQRRELQEVEGTHSGN
jgi:hypothetical protein